MTKPLVSILIANYNGELYLSPCLSSVLKTKYPHLEVLIIDDCSTDASLSLINQFLFRDSRLHIYQNSQNLGAAASRNQLARYAKGEYIVFLDNDTQVHPDWLNELILTLESSSDIGATQSLILDYHHRDRIQMAGGLLIPATGWLQALLQNSSYVKAKKSLTRQPIFAISAALAVRRQILDQINWFDTLEAVHTEDIDLSWRIWLSGSRIVLSPRSFVYHWTKTLSDRQSMHATYQRIYFHLAKNSIRSMLKNYQPISLIKYLPACIVINLLRGCLFPFSRRGLAAFSGSFSALLWNLSHITDTITNRRIIQTQRAFSDRDLFRSAASPVSVFNLYRVHL